MARKGVEGRMKEGEWGEESGCERELSAVQLV